MIIDDKKIDDVTDDDGYDFTDVDDDCYDDNDFLIILIVTV